MKKKNTDKMGVSEVWGKKSVESIYWSMWGESGVSDPQTQYTARACASSRAPH